MNYYFIDIENVGNDGFKGWDKLGNNDKIVVFLFSKGSLSVDMQRILKNTKANVEVIKYDVHTKNAADFKIVTYIGYLVAKSSNNSYVIISKDTGFASAVEQLKFLDKDIDVCVRPSISNVYSRLTRVERRTIMEKSLSSLSGDFDKEIYELLVNVCAKSLNLSDLNSRLLHTFKKKNVEEIYRKIKPLYSDALEKIG